jgi:exopolysaccharide biosynthesis protein
MYSNFKIKFWSRLLILLLGLSLFVIPEYEVFSKIKTKKKSVATTSKAKKTTKTKTKAQKGTKKPKKTTKKTKKKWKKQRIPSKRVALNVSKILETTELTDGIVYKRVQFGNDNARIIAHLVETDIEGAPSSIAILKAKNSIDELDHLKNIYDDFYFELSRIYEGQIFALTNGSFWSAYTNYPIGILVIDGEVVGMKKYRNWSSTFFDESSRPYIDNFELEGSIIKSNRKKITIDNVNRRVSENDIVLYNAYYGDTIPKVKRKDVEALLKEYLLKYYREEFIEDSTEAELDTTELRSQIIDLKRAESQEFSTVKVVCSYLEKPAINRPIDCKIVAIDTGAVAIPVNGFVISIPKHNFFQYNFEVGENIQLKFETDRYRYISFKNAVSGTPRIVRKGGARPEAYQEGSRGRRFIGGQLPRTAIGTNFAKTKIYLIVVEPTNVHSQTYGATLSQLAVIAKRLGCYDAMNLDGGGSSSLIVNGTKVSSPIGSDGRKVSVGVGVVKYR